MLHQKADTVATSATTKTFINFFSRGNSERRTFFIMKRAETKVISASFFQFNEGTYYLDDIDTA